MSEAAGTTGDERWMIYLMQTGEQDRQRLAITHEREWLAALWRARFPIGSSERWGVVRQALFGSTKPQRKWRRASA